MRNLYTGFIISDNGYIPTNNHVMEDAETIMVTMSDESSYHVAVIAANDGLIAMRESTGYTMMEAGFIQHAQTPYRI